MRKMSLALVLLSVLLSGCASERSLIDETIAAAHDRVGVLEERLAAIEKAPPETMDEESRELASDLRESIGRISGWIEWAEAYREQTEGQTPIEIGETIAGGLAASGVPYAGMIAAILGGFGAWSRERKRTDQLIKNVKSSGIVGSAPADHREKLLALNMATGLESRIEKVRKGI